MVTNRRNFILGAGGSLALVSAAGIWHVTRMPKKAIEPWQLDPDPPADARMDAFRHAILAPNPHNRQPWLIQLEGNDSAIISCDLDKRLPETDPFDRQIVIGFGTFLELARIAAAEREIRMDMTLFPEGEPQPRLDTRPVARLTFVADKTVRRDPLYKAILARRTNREIYSQSAPTARQLAALQAGDVNTTSDPALLGRLRAITVAAISDEMNTRRTMMETVRLLRIGRDEVDAAGDGLALTGPMIEATRSLGLTSRETLADPTSAAFKIGLDGQRKIYDSVPAAFWISTPGNTRAEQLEAGRRYVRATLRAAALGLAIHPMSQSLQEYPEMANHLAEVHTLLGASLDHRIQMLARIGHAPSVTPAPRLPLQSHIVA
ncbi:MAG: twin-arginine translocation pathway signal protein [Sphingomonadales bacterium]|nr:twin-arginine translocation pathway signal protein [Sphingomonadales bacterium]MBK8860555.1 twin-arginine translocation pathway signal protein [Sphingomonadales bacterium]